MRIVGGVLGALVGAVIGALLLMQCMCDGDRWAENCGGSLPQVALAMWLGIGGIGGFIIGAVTGVVIAGAVRRSEDGGDAHDDDQKQG